jgi:ATP-dependent DNA helicase RecG
MQPSLEKLTKFIKLEAERGYDNKAVVGGLDKIIHSWEAEARADNLAEDLIVLVKDKLGNYPNLEPETRESSLNELWNSLPSSRKEQLRRGPNHESQNKPTQDRPQLAPERPQNYRPERPPQNPPATKREAPAPVSRELGRAVKPDTTNGLGLNAPLTVIQGIGPKHAETLSGLGLQTLGDLLYYFPRRYDDYSQLKPIIRLWYGEDVTVIGTVQNAAVRPYRGGSSSIVEASISDGSGSLRLTWFNQPWIANRLHPGLAIVVSGTIDQYLGRLMMNNPDWEPMEQEHLHTNRIVPVYPLTAKITQRWLRRVIHETVSYWAPRIPDYLPQSAKSAVGLIDLPTALMEAHFPSSVEKLRAARERLAFDEVFLLQMGVFRQKRSWREVVAQVYEVGDDWLTSQLERLPFILTNAQQQTLADIRADLASGHPMNRLIQGDVGSGKTVVAALGMAMIAGNGAQASLMAPTGILAEQHYKTLLRLLTGSEENPTGGVLSQEEICLLVGDTPEAEKEHIRQGLEDGSIKVIVGTHALIEAPVTFNNLQMVVVDEQHRFGVEQRAALRQKGTNPHLLVMTATPIPRSLALTIYGDLDLSVIDEMPTGRQAIETHVVFPRERERAYSLILNQIEEGHQAFIIYPLIEQGENDEVRAAVSEHTRLQAEVFPHRKVGLLHGRLRPDEKDAVMAAFRDRTYDVLVSTSVVEVGVDIPNATVMLIEGANRFGLAQLHQFRGRVGRGEAKSYCLLIPDSEDRAENERLSAMVETNDGFVLAERDLSQRGPGEFLGTRQSGYSGGLQMANLTNVPLIEKARDQAQAIFQADPELSLPEHSELFSTMRRFWGEGKGDIS